MGKISNWLIHQLGGYTLDDYHALINSWTRKNVIPHRSHMLTAAYSYYVHPDTYEVRRDQEKTVVEALAGKIATEMMARGLIHLDKQEDILQDRTAKRYRMRATALVADPAQLPSMGGDQP